MNQIRMNASDTPAFENCPAGFVTSEELNRLKHDPIAFGSAAHEYAEIMMKGKLGLGDVEALNQKREIFEINSLFYDLTFERDVMKYVDHCVELVTQAKVVDDQPVIFVEEWLDMGKWAPDQTSKVDYALIAGGTLVVVDMKTGKFAESAEGNKQLLYYALALMKRYYEGYNINKVVLTIVNVKHKNSISSVEMTTDELLRLGNEMLARNESMDVRADYTQPHCNKCNLGSYCRHNYVYMTEQLNYMINEDAAIDFSDPTEAAEMYRKAVAMEKYAKEMQDTIREEAIVRGIKVEGYKLIHGNIRTKYTDERALVQLLFDKYPDLILDLLKPKSYAQYKNLGGELGDDVRRTINMSGLMQSLENRSSLVLESKDGVEVYHKQAIL